MATRLNFCDCQVDLQDRLILMIFNNLSYISGVLLLINETMTFFVLMFANLLFMLIV